MVLLLFQARQVEIHVVEIPRVQNTHQHVLISGEVLPHPFHTDPHPAPLFVLCHHKAWISGESNNEGRHRQVGFGKRHALYQSEFVDQVQEFLILAGIVEI